MRQPTQFLNKINVNFERRESSRLQSWSKKFLNTIWYIKSSFCNYGFYDYPNIIKLSNLQLVGVDCNQ